MEADIDVQVAGAKDNAELHAAVGGVPASGAGSRERGLPTTG